MKAKKFLFILLNIVALLLAQAFLLASFLREINMSPFVRVLILCAAFGCVYFADCLLWHTSSKERARVYTRDMFLCFFGLYVVLLVTMVLFDSYFGRTGSELVFIWDVADRAEYIAQSVNLVPFSTIGCFFWSISEGAITAETFWVNIAGNLFAFAPFALFLPVLFNVQRKLWVFLLTIVLIVITVETAQLVLLTGFCDIDDLILNTIGAVVVYALLWRTPLCKLTHRFAKTD